MNLTALIARRLALVVTLALLLSATAYGAGWASRDATGTTEPAPSPAPAVVREARTTTATATPVARPALRAGRGLLATGDRGRRVRELQARLAQIDWFHARVTGYYGPVTTAAVRGFQAKRRIPVTGTVDRRTWRRLRGMTRVPTAAELSGRSGSNTPGRLDPRCTTGRVLCIDKTSRTVRWVVGGRVRRTLDARFGGSATPTREGSFVVERKSRDHVSSIYGTAMPYAMFFSRGQAVHYSPDFAAVGYAGASHGCVNVRDRAGIARLFDRVRLGDRVVVHRG